MTGKVMMRKPFHSVELTKAYIFSENDSTALDGVQNEEVWLSHDMN